MKLTQHELSILAALKQHFALPARQIAYITSMPLTSFKKNIAKLQQEQLITRLQFGAHHYYQLNEQAFAKAMIDISALEAESAKLRSPPTKPADEALKTARTCYGHLAGKLGVALANKLQADHLVVKNEEKYQLTPTGKKRIESLGISVTSKKRKFESLEITPCLDWTERRFHFAGPFAKELTAQMFEQGWISQNKKSRTVTVTPLGQKAFAEEFGLETKYENGQLLLKP